MRCPPHLFKRGPGWQVYHGSTYFRLYAPRLLGFTSAASTSATMSATSQSRCVTPAAIAGEVRSLCRQSGRFGTLIGRQRPRSRSSACKATPTGRLVDRRGRAFFHFTRRDIHDRLGELVRVAGALGGASQRIAPCPSGIPRCFASASTASP